jgi:perosamine synthetase
MIPVAKPWFGAEEEAAVVEVLRSGWVTQGPKVAAFETAFAEYVGAPHAVALSSGTAALHAALVALGVGAGDEVVCPSLSFIATANAIAHAGARPVFADVDERTFNVTAATVERALTSRTRAILAVHQVGLPCDLDELAALALARGLILVEDAACAIGASYRGVRIGRPHGAAACFSFHPRKILTCGEGGMVATSDAAIAERLRRLRHHGLGGAAYVEVGYNYRLTDVQSAIGVVQLGKLDAMLSRRRAQAARYDALLRGVRGVETPWSPSDREPNFQSYVVRLRGAERARRDATIERLAAAGIATRPGVMAAHLEPAYAGARVALPVTEAIAAETIALPLFHDMTDVEQNDVVRALGAP